MPAASLLSRFPRSNYNACQRMNRPYICSNNSGSQVSEKVKTKEPRKKRTSNDDNMHARMAPTSDSPFHLFYRAESGHDSAFPSTPSWWMTAVIHHDEAMSWSTTLQAIFATSQKRGFRAMIMLTWSHPSFRQK
jgi:hypothetical protein